MNPITSNHTLFVADIHLQPDEFHPINQAFHQFLIDIPPNTEALYILGDLFEVWVGDDIGIKTYQKTIQHLNRLTSNGLDIYLLYGNRDFLMRHDFWQATGIKFIKEPTKLQIYELEILIMHGDILCTDDVEYQKMRKILRHPIITWIFLRLSQKRRIKIGKKMREKSKKHSSNKSQNIMDVNQQAVIDLFKQYPSCTNLIHGHTHRPKHHEFQQNGQEYHRWVLGDWRPETQVIKVYQNQEIQLAYISPNLN